MQGQGQDFTYSYLLHVAAKPPTIAIKKQQWTQSDNDNDKDNDKDQDKDKDLNLVLKESLRTRTDVSSSSLKSLMRLIYLPTTRN